MDRRLAIPAVVGLLAGTLAAITLTGATTTAAPARTDGPFTSGQAAIDRLGARLPDVAAVNGMDPAALRGLLLDDETLAVDRFGSLAYFDLRPPGEPAASASPSAAVDPTPSAAPPVTGPEFQLASLPGADLTIFLDFDGHVTTGTTWNTQYGVSTITSPPYDTDGRPDSWSSAELSVVRDAWAVVAEDFAPWQVNVTTIDPGPDALRYTGPGDRRWGVRAVITQDTFASCGCGGHAYLGAFDDSQDEPAFVYNSSFTGVSEAISHEVGHTLWLAHDGTVSGSAYYRGHDGTGPGWAPIMGASYYEEVSHWSRQEYYDANNTGPTANYDHGDDDVAIVSDTSLGNLPRRVDDHGGFDAPTALAGSTPGTSGVIESRTDVDAFSFATDGGAVAIVATPATIAPNLDIGLTLRNAIGDVVATASPIDRLDASIDVTLPAGGYVVEIDGVGVGDPAANPPSGYTDYGSMGQYTLSATIEQVAVPDTTPPAAPTGLTGAETAGDVVLSWDANAETDLAGYVVQRDPGTGFGDLDATTTTSYRDVGPGPGQPSYRVIAVDAAGNRSAPSDPVTVTVPVSLVSHATAEIPIAGTVSGTSDATAAAGGAVETITEVTSSGKRRSRHDLLEHRWELPVVAGGQVLTIHAATVDGGDADDGVRFEVSDDGVRWEPVVTVPANGSVAASWDIGQRTGSVLVRVIDTDRSIGEDGLDRVDVDLLEIVGDGVVVTPADPVEVTASITTAPSSAARGEQHGTATVLVVDDHGDPVAGATVTVRFGGAFADESSAATSADGSVTFVTADSARKPSFSACVVSVTATLPYVPGAEAC